MPNLIPTQADQQVAQCLEEGRSFAMIAGAGAGKTTSLISALEHVRKEFGSSLLKQGQRVACITYTKRAVAVIRERLGFDELFEVSTLHSFLWGEMGRFQVDIHEALTHFVIPKHIESARDKDNGGASKTAIAARQKAEKLEGELEALADASAWAYDDSNFSNFSEGLLGHDDVIAVAGYLLGEKSVFRRILGSRYPFIFVDEAQDTFVSIVEGLNELGAGVGLPLVGYFGDPWQQIYDGRAGDFSPPEEGLSITKTENFRCSPQVVGLLNAFRTDVEQVPSGKAADIEGSVEMVLVEAETPEGPRRTYTSEQRDRALQKMDQAIESWGWTAREDVTLLFLVRQMIARRLGFEQLNSLFTGDFASSRAQDDFEAGDHVLVRPFIKLILPLIRAQQDGDQRRVIDLLRANSPSFSADGPNSNLSLGKMIELSRNAIEKLEATWASSTVKEVLLLAQDLGLARMPNRLVEHLSRDPRSEAFDKELHSQEKGDWLADAFFAMSTEELSPYFDFISENTPFSTQHGVKGEEYPNVVVVFDDVEARWSHYNFNKLLTPRTIGEPTEGQFDRGRKLAYVCFSRAELNLRILLFTPSPADARAELLSKGLFEDGQIKVVSLAA
ncbi:UvrD-helicase domain-containing protein [Litoreibacter roseus]|uniref:DNA 3'-5' helicase II n=1 Tax=Litoreibacter roseus TaxID=2601869 RepID=A0A6N6JLZ9_9RHOB|nr:UvrD-helicase domain-containing protein [Litoreibacter roseus]GFE67331.1 DNA helicase [Litoreibacter roseus]